jgi:hypothetical protein
VIHLLQKLKDEEVVANSSKILRILMREDIFYDKML